MIQTIRSSAFTLAYVQIVVTERAAKADMVNLEFAWTVQRCRNPEALPSHRPLAVTMPAVYSQYPQ